MSKRAPRVSLKAAHTYIANAEEFNAGNLSGEHRPRGAVYPGRLTGPDRVAFLADALNIRYVVRSYVTPIAWLTVTDSGERRHVVTQKFSVTTSRHQNALPESIKSSV